VRGYKAQCELLFEQLRRLVERCEATCASLICEGVHLSISFVVKLMQV
jgi:2-phosphoglycerate kinase